MNDETKARLSVVIVAAIGVGITICGMVDHLSAMDSGDAFGYTDGGIRMIFGCLFVLISLVMKIWIDVSMKMHEEISILQGRIDYLEDKMHKESYSHDIEDEVP